MLFTSVAIQSDGKILVAGSAIVAKITNVALARYNSDGSLDTSFGPSLSGIITQQIGEGATANAIVFDSVNNKIILAGVCVQSRQSRLLLMCFNMDGSLDTNFGNNGSIILAVNVHTWANAIALQPNDNKIIVAGITSNNIEQCLLVRFNTNGTQDVTFGNNGIVTANLGSQSHFNDLVVQSDGNIIAVGFADNNYILARYTSVGSLDSSFGINGIVIRPFGLSSQANSVVLDLNNKITITGFSNDNLLIARYTSNGILDSEFNGSGENMLADGSLNIGHSLILQSDGKIIVAGLTDDNFLLARFNTNGLIDTIWGTGGIVDQPGTDSNQNITLIWEQQPAGTNAGTFTSGAWQVRNLNQISTSDPAISLSANQFTIGPGKYDVLISVPAYRVGNHQARLQNITDGVTAAYGASVFSSSSISTVSISVIGTPLVLLKPTTFQVQHKCTITEANDGFGIAAGIGAAEVYTQIKITPSLN